MYLGDEAALDQVENVHLRKDGGDEAVDLEGCRLGRPLDVPDIRVPLVSGTAPTGAAAAPETEPKPGFR